MINNWIKALLLRTFLNLGVKFGKDGVDKWLKAQSKVDEYDFNQISLNKDFNGYLWLYLIVLFMIWVVLIKYYAWEGATAALFFSISILVIAHTIHGVIREISVHPGNIHGYNESQNRVGNYSNLGSKFHNTIRQIWFYRWYRFLYTKSGEGWSYRPYLLIIVFIALLYWTPLISFAFASLFIATFIMVCFKMNFPIALYMGSSSLDSHILFKKIRNISRIKWISLLHDTVALSDSPTNTMEDFSAAIEKLALTNTWSLRLQSDDDWLNVVKELIDHSAVILVKVDEVDAVQQELDALASAHYLNRVIIIGDLSQKENFIPAALHHRVILEKDAFELLSHIHTSPGKFLARMKDLSG
ncbi:hypothetical protein [Thalassomonas sp. RHCl1]|uniref:hypothetical protein n=1 Tax=Thalassomonas sp. RHCl1 TaxID=2995320 RepID=UPI00248C69A3|nr:hypothetical protein [Thalassomonas sp. RHCl1]